MRRRLRLALAPRRPLPGAVPLCAVLALGCAGAPSRGASPQLESPPTVTMPAADAETEPAATSAPESDEQRAAAALDQLVKACRDGDVDAAAAGVVDRSPGAPPWSRAADASQPEARRAVEAICARIVGELRGGTYERLGYQRAQQSEGVWHVCPVRYAATGEEAAFAFLEIDGAMLLGDID